MEELSGAERERFQEALLSAFPSVSSLEQMVLYKCNRRLDEFTSGALRNRVFELLKTAEAEGWTAELVAGASAANPGNPKLSQFHRGYQASVQRSLPGPKLERIVSLAKGFLNPALWRDRLAAIEAQVCRIERQDGEALGTGFLVSRNVVLTNFHVIEHEQPGTLQVRFDHKLLPGQQEPLQLGKVYRTTKLLAQSPYSPADLKYPQTELPTPAQLDYALLQVEGTPGEEGVGGRARGWLELPSQQPALEAESLIVIVQHPKGQPMKVAFDAFLALNANQTRITYRTNTEEGSSGSPCFDESLKLVALHHSGDPRMHLTADFNEGIPAATIRESLSQELKGLLGWS
jgi:V8-like Glu-specific endopeptidase